MTTTSTFASLSVPAPDDSMEMSSPANRNLDDDIDIDFDDYSGGIHGIDDEHMLEDGDQTRPTTATDDMMEDDLLPAEGVQIEEDVMQDDGVKLPEEDEELIDYGEDEFQDEQVDDVVISNAVEEPANLSEAAHVTASGKVVDPPEAIDPLSNEDVIDEINDDIHEEVPEEPTEHFTEDAEQPTGQSGDAEEALASNLTAEDGTAAEREDDAAAEPDVQATESYFDEAAGDDAFASHDVVTIGEESEEVKLPPMSINTDVTAQIDTPGTPTDTGLHPMSVRYYGTQIPLFKSKRQPDGLLKDDNLASLSLAELMKNCRLRLALKIGENISEDQDLVLAFDQLGLMLVEDSRAAFESSLNDVLEVYLQLYRNDGFDEMPPLSINLTVQLKFASSFNMLKNAAAGGQGLSSFQSMQVQDDEQEEFYQEPEEFHQQGEFQEDAADDSFTGEEHVETSNDRDQGHVDEETADAIYNASEDPTVTVEDGLDDDQERPSAIAEKVINTADSTASSTTVQGDVLDEHAGEYGDIIDWDDDSLTSDISEHAEDGQDDFSTFLTEYEDAEQGFNLSKDNQEGHEDDVDDAGADQDHEQDAEQSYHEQNFGQENFDNEFQAHDYGQETQYFDQEAGEEEGDYGAEEGDHEYDQADTYGAQQEEDPEAYNPDYQPGENDEQFHTAQDFLNDGEDLYDHGPEDDNHREELEDGLDDTVDTVIHHELDDDEFQEGDAQEDFEDEIGFDEDEDHNDAAEEDLYRSPRAKRSFEEHTGDDELEANEPELKRVRSK